MAGQAHHGRTGRSRPGPFWRLVVGGWAFAGLAAALLTWAAAGPVSTAAAAGTTGGSTPSGGTVITTTNGPFGTMLVVGSGQYAGYSLYLLTSDQPGKSSCTTKTVDLPQGPTTCTGPSSDSSAEWPAITTTGPPVAAGGVKSDLLGSVNRAGIGDQVTYAGHPLYLFDTGPGQITGQGWDEPSLPPWHGLWWLVAPSGRPLAWPGMLTVTTVQGKSVLASMMFTGIGWKAFPVYSYSKDSPSSSTCTGSCAVAWPPVLTTSRPGVGKSLTASEVGSIKRSDGTSQATYDGKPLYLYSQEAIAKQGSNYVATGSGNGLKSGGGTFHLVRP
jgi:predicted lipoprotein with Yx(FWY)xxD motif